MENKIFTRQITYPIWRYIQYKKGLNKHTPHVSTELLKYVIIPILVTEKRFKNLKKVLSVFHIFYNTLNFTFWNNMCIFICIQHMHILVLVYSNL